MTIKTWQLSPEEKGNMLGMHRAWMLSYCIARAVNMLQLAISTLLLTFRDCDTIVSSKPTCRLYKHKIQDTRQLGRILLQN